MVVQSALGERLGRCLPLALMLALALMLGGAGLIALAKNKSGTGGADKINGTSGADRLNGREGPDRIKGFAGPDRLRGGRGSDLLRGGRGADRLVGGKGGDRLIGGAGRDEINMRNGVEIASPGRDRIEARDGSPDQINCGDGWDRVRVDAVEEGVYNCEVIKAPKVEGERIG